jgi:CBS domain-containing protein
MKVSDCMTSDVRIVAPDQTLQDAARTMAEIDAGFLPVGENDRLVGIITDRDIAIRGIGTGRAPTAKVRDVMTEEVKYCFEDDDTDTVLDNMADIQLRRMPVLDHRKRMVGIVSITDLASNGGDEAAHAGEALAVIAQPSPHHSQAI